jgi:hypothetical protein
LSNTFGVLASQTDVLIVDAELDEGDGLPIAAMASGDIVVQVSPAAASIKDAYSLIKRLNAQLGRRPFGILVTDADEREAEVVYQNMAQAASRYLAVQLYSIGSVPTDDHHARCATRSCSDRCLPDGWSLGRIPPSGGAFCLACAGRRFQGLNSCIPRPENRTRTISSASMHRSSRSSRIR